MLYRAHLLSPDGSARLKEFADGGLLVDEAGRIVDAGAFEALEAAHPGAEVMDLRPHWILPGLIDLHSHLPQFECVALDGLELMPWLETHIFPAEARFRDSEVAARAARDYFRSQLALGTTTSVAYLTVHPEAADRAFREAERCGIRAVLGKVMMDMHAPEALLEDTGASLRQSEELCETWHGRDGGRLRYAFTPRFAPVCSGELMAGLARAAQRHGAYIQTHISESVGEIERVRELFPEAADYTAVYAAAGMLGPRTLLGHGIHLSRSEREVIRESGATIVHCPRSNEFIKSGIMPLRRWLSEGLSVGLATDVGGGPKLDMWGEMAAACNASKTRWALQRLQGLRLDGVEGLDGELRTRIALALDLDQDDPVTPVEAFHLATLHGARALGLEAETGSLDPGKDADFIVVDPRRVDPAASRAVEPAEEMLSRLLYRSDPAMIRATYVRGRRCHALGA
ncbi:guanine deaminase [Mesoterricola silvestris]|uniref:Guanine deaminase n=1 Tax=Mesoterricola silvestris TaxID=2927979 RepID=A0AA48GUN6_9BACT|nr:guanine deaminase [Mesoterricola silvestris]BDU74387.1 guanine deaminase [Mesoterricola silvestris]